MFTFKETENQNFDETDFMTIWLIKLETIQNFVIDLFYSFDAEDLIWKKNAEHGFVIIKPIEA